MFLKVELLSVSCAFAMVQNNIMQRVKDIFESIFFTERCTDKIVEQM